MYCFLILGYRVVLLGLDLECWFLIQVLFRNLYLNIEI